jgi:hypothetical protein
VAAPNDQAASVAIDSSGSAYVAGATASLDFPTQSPEQYANARPAGNAWRTNGFITKFSADGQSLVYSTYLGGTDGNWYSSSLGPTGDAIAALAVDSSGNAWRGSLSRPQAAVRVAAPAAAQAEAAPVAAAQAVPQAWTCLAVYWHSC